MREFSSIWVMKGGKPKPLSPAMVLEGLKQFGDGEEVLVTFAEPEIGRSRQQEKFFHGPVLKAFEELGYRKEEAKAMLCLRFIPMEITLPDGSVVLVPGSTSKLTKKAYRDLIEECIQFAAEQGLYVEESAEWRMKNRDASRLVRGAGEPETARVGAGR